MVDTKDILNTFDKHDVDESGKLDRLELKAAIGDVMNSNAVDLENVENVIKEFDKDGDGEIDFCEFKTLMKYLRIDNTRRRASVVMEETDVSAAPAQPGSSALSLSDAIKKSKKESRMMLQGIISKIYPVKDILCVQDDLPVANDSHTSRMVNYDSYCWTDDDKEEGMDPEFESAFPPSSMRCLALVSHNQMKSAMREFVMANKNLLKKFRLTGTNSTMMMLKEVFKDDPAGTIMFGPACVSGPLGGDAELVALMVTGRIGGIVFFQDPMNAHPHRADIDCLLRQALVHNTMMAETPTTALMLTHCLRQALQGKGKPEMIPSFFFSLQCPSVEAYKAEQKAVVNAQRAKVRQSMAAPLNFPRPSLAFN